MRVFLVDDHPVVREGLKMLVSRCPAVVVGEAASAAEAADKLAGISADVVLLDLALGAEDGMALLARIRETMPALKVLVVTGNRDPEKHRQVLLAGAHGLVLKEKPPEMLLKALERVHAGELWFDRGTLDSALRRVLGHQEDPDRARMATLTAREREIVACIGEGLKNAEIARRLGIGEKTVRNHLSTIFDKLGVSDRLELLVYVHRHQAAAVADRDNRPARETGN